jgi:hypothetical protein
VAECTTLLEPPVECPQSGHLISITDFAHLTMGHELKIILNEITDQAGQLVLDGPPDTTTC